jgi:hypothetical protein
MARSKIRTSKTHVAHFHKAFRTCNQYPRCSGKLSHCYPFPRRSSDNVGLVGKHRPHFGNFAVRPKRRGRDSVHHLRVSHPRINPAAMPRSDHGRHKRVHRHEPRESNGVSGMLQHSNLSAENDQEWLRNTVLDLRRPPMILPTLCVEQGCHSPARNVAVIVRGSTIPKVGLVNGEKVELPARWTGPPCSTLARTAITVTIVGTRRVVPARPHQPAVTVLGCWDGSTDIGK